jgi:hypothetical protein
VPGNVGAGTAAASLRRAPPSWQQTSTSLPLDLFSTRSKRRAIRPIARSFGMTDEAPYKELADFTVTEFGRCR